MIQQTDLSENGKHAAIGSFLHQHYATLIFPIHAGGGPGFFLGGHITETCMLSDVNGYISKQTMEMKA